MYVNLNTFARYVVDYNSCRAINKTIPFILQEENTTVTKEKETEKETKDAYGGGQASRTLEERRRSMLDHHWAVPSKDRCTLSVEDEQQDSLNSDKVGTHQRHKYDTDLLTSTI